ncbi:hypothetical protein OXX59_004598 [Metschnikowia pulcherrima]
MKSRLGLLRAPCVRYSTNLKESATQANHAIATRQQLFVTDPVTPGSVFFLPHGTRVFNKLIGFMKHQQARHGFDEVVTPLIYKTQLWEQSGHWQNYKDDMFKVVGNVSRDEKEVPIGEPGNAHEIGQKFEPEIRNGELENGGKGVKSENSGECEKTAGFEQPKAVETAETVDSDALHEYGLKPMNCPGHCLIYAKFDRSYNELPIRYSDFSSLHRNEASGALSGLTRVRRFHQDDGHIFCTLAQLPEEISNTLKMIKDTYAVFGIAEKDIEFYLSTRPEKYMGEPETWQTAEQQLAEALDACTDKWQERPGDGAFYGPKIDVLLTDAFGKRHQVGTVQLDFQLPQRFQLSYTGADGSREHRPIMVHRAVFGSLERFFAILLDHYQGKWPFWLNPRQAIIIPVSSRHVDAAEDVQKRLLGDIMGAHTVAPLTGYNFYVDVDKRNETVGTRIKDALHKGYSYIVMVGDRDIANGTVSVRSRDSRAVENVAVDDLYRRFIELERAFQ